ncbi:MAG: hypothetical protein KBH11_13990 [Bacteroidia bacterium]|nr:hypothetical protein [Bacteroidia bacterium]
MSYIPGRCNIGPKELMVRRKFLMFFLPVSFGLSIAIFSFPESKLMWTILLLTSFSAIVLIREIATKFCVLFGFFSLYNFKQLGNLDHVVNSQNKNHDRRRVLKILVASLLFAFVYTSLLHYVAITFEVH